MAVLLRTFTQLYTDTLGPYLYNTLTLSAAQKVEAKRIVNEGYAEFLAAHDWTFLSPEATYTVWTTSTSTCDEAPVKDNGTSTVTVDDAIFYATMVGFDLTIGENDYAIASYTSTTVVVVTGDASGEADEAVVSVTPSGTYALPTDFGSLVDRFTYGSEANFRPLANTTPEHIRALRSQEADPSGDPRYAAIQPHAYTVTTGQLWDLELYPTPNALRTLHYRYRVNAAEMAADAEYPHGGQIHAMTIRQACLMMAERSKGIVNGEMARIYYGDGTPSYPGLLPMSIRRDNDMRARNIGYNGDESDGVSAPVRMGTWTYE